MPKDFLKILSSLAGGMTFCKGLHQLGFCCDCISYPQRAAFAHAQLQSSLCEGREPPCIVCAGLDEGIA